MTPTMKLDTSGWKLPKDIKLADDHFYEPGGIDLLLGAELFYEIMQSGRYTRPNRPVLQETTLGWMLAGNTPIVTATTKAPHAFILKDDTLEKNLNRFREIEPMEQSTMTAEQRACEDNFLDHTTHQSDGRFVVKLPTKVEPVHLGASRLSAERRLHSIE
jgi:hypothetical protein